VDFRLASDMRAVASTIPFDARVLAKVEESDCGRLPSVMHGEPKPIAVRLSTRHQSAWYATQPPRECVILAIARPTPKVTIQGRACGSPGTIRPIVREIRASNPYPPKPRMLTSWEPVPRPAMCSRHRLSASVLDCLKKNATPVEPQSTADRADPVEIERPCWPELATHDHPSIRCRVNSVSRVGRWYRRSHRCR